MRLFIGVRVPDEIRNRMAEVGRKLESKVREARVVSSENLHVTLKFLGETKEEDVPRIAGILSASLKNNAPFKATVKAAGVFPDEKNIRVFWIGMDSQGELKRINTLIETELDKAGICKKEDRFREHITIARFKSIPKISFLKELMEKYSEEIFGEMEVNGIELIRSDLKPSGPVYTTLSKIPLGKR